MGPPLIILQLMMTVTFFMAITGFLGFACWSWLGTRELTRKHGTHISTGSWTGFRIIIIPNIILGVSVNSRNSRHRRRRHGWGPAATRRWWSGAGLAFVCQYYAKAQGGTHHRALWPVRRLVSWDELEISSSLKVLVGHAPKIVEPINQSGSDHNNHTLRHRLNFYSQAHSMFKFDYLLRERRRCKICWWSIC